MKKLKIFKLFAIFAIAVLGFTTCQKFDEVPPDGKSSGTPQLTTLIADSITTKSVFCGGNITADGGKTISVKGLCWDTIENPTVEKNKTINGLGIGEFKTTITGLNHNKTYYLKAYVVTNSGTFYGNQITFKTLDLTIPVVLTLNLTNITSTTATCESKIDNDGGSNISARGVCWSSAENPVVTGNHTTNGTGTGNFTSNITGLTHGTTYFVRAYATNSSGTSYGNQLSFTAGIGINLPVITTANITDITATTAVCGGNITNDGNSDIVEKGVCWSTSTNPTVTNSHTSNGTGTGSFNSNLSGLTAGTTYYVRAYATNSAGTAYGDEKSFTTSAILPTVTTTSISSITSSSATSGGNVTNDGAGTVTAKGVCWSTSQNPTVSGSHTINGTGTGSFSSSITGLTAGTTYYVRAYATNSAGTAYGAELSLNTLANIPVLTTTTVTSITATTAISGGNISSNGGGTITAKGVCWSTLQNPVATGSHTSNGTGNDSFNSSITGLFGGETYYVRSYATNSAGTAYGNQLSFTTNETTPSVVTSPINSITSTTAYCGGNITASGGAPVTARGICWSVTQNPTISDSYTTNETGTGVFSTLITELTANTTYYVRAYATNIHGTSYGNQISFTTLDLISIGSNYAGGIIFYIDETEQHGLVCSPTDQGSAEWGCFNSAIMGTSVDIYTGSTNTDLIINECFESGYAAKLCYNLTLNTYSDWFLPSRSELNLMYVNLKSHGFGDFASSYYWSSSEVAGYEAYRAWIQDFSNGDQLSNFGKGVTGHVRAVRSF